MRRRLAPRQLLYHRSVIEDCKVAHTDALSVHEGNSCIADDTPMPDYLVLRKSCGRPSGQTATSPLSAVSQCVASIGTLEVVDRISACRNRAGAKRSAFLPQFCDVGTSASESGDQKFHQPEKESSGSFPLGELLQAHAVRDFQTASADYRSQKACDRRPARPPE